MVRPKSIIVGCLGILLLSAAGAWASPQDEAQKPTITSAENTAFRAADEDENTQDKLKLLDGFVAQYPESTLMPDVYRDYYLAYFFIKNYGQTIEYADRFLALGDSTALGYRLEALMTRAEAFVANCGEATFQTSDAYTKAGAAAVTGLRTIDQYPISGDCKLKEARCLSERERVQTLFYSVLAISHSGLEGNVVDSCVQQTVDVDKILLFSWQKTSSKTRSVELNEFQETKHLRLAPSYKFEVACEVHAEPDLSEGDFMLWITVDFLVAPVNRKYEEMGTDQIGPSAIWDRSAEMHDLKPMPIYHLTPGETRRVVLKDFDLAKVLAAFPVGAADNQWPWFLRLNIHVQDRSGRQIGSAERIVRLRPDAVRNKEPTMPIRIQN